MGEHLGGTKEPLIQKAPLLPTLSMASRAAPLLSVARTLVKARTFATARPDMGKTYVVGVGMTKFEKPGRRENFDYPDMAKEAVDKAMADSGLKYTDVEQACVGYVYGDSTCGQRALYPLGMTGIPVYNVNNTYGGKFVVNPSGGLISKGHPLGATGLAQCNELVSQLRGEADKRQVDGATAALQHNLGLGGAVVVALYKMGFPEATQAKAKL